MEVIKMDLKTIIEMINKIKKPFFWNGKEWENASNYREKISEEGYRNIVEVLEHHGVYAPDFNLLKMP